MCPPSKEVDIILVFNVRNVREHNRTKNLMLVENKEEQDLLQLCQQIGYGEVICHVTDGQIDLEEAMIKKCVQCNKGPWKSTYKGGGLGEPSKEQKIALMAIREIPGAGLARITVTGGQPCKVESIYTHSQCKRLA